MRYDAAPLRQESCVPLSRRLPSVLLWRGFALRNPTLRRRLSVLERRARWSGRAFVVVTAGARS